MSKHLMTAGITMALLIGLTGCSDFRRAVGKEKSTPDEFKVVVRPPLSLPPGFSDRPDPCRIGTRFGNGWRYLIGSRVWVEK